MTESPMVADKPSLLFHCERAAALFASFAMLGMMLVGAADVIGTAGFNAPVPGAYELTEALMVCAVFLALALSQREGRQIRVELVVQRLGPRARAMFDLVSELLSMFVYAVIAWYGWSMATESWQIGELSSGLLRFPIWPAKLALALGASLMTAQCFAGAIISLRRAA